MNARPPIAFDALLPDLPQALCAQIGDPEMWHPGPGGRNAQAKSICGRCPEMDGCLAYALEHNVSGIWGGTSEDERKEWRSEQGQWAVPVSGEKFLPTRSDARRAMDLPEIEHGTRNGAVAHRSRGEDVCDPCIEAERVYRRANRAKKAAA